MALGSDKFSNSAVLLIAGCAFIAFLAAIMLSNLRNENEMLRLKNHLEKTKEESLKNNPIEEYSNPKNFTLYVEPWRRRYEEDLFEEHDFSENDNTKNPETTE